MKEYVRTYIVLPSTIYGIATGVLVDQGMQNPHSVQVPSLISAALDRGRAGIVGEGKNIWPDVSIDDIGDLFIVLFDSIRENPATGHGREGFYFGETGEHNLYEVGKAIGEALVELGKLDNPEPTTFTKEETDKYFQVLAYFGTNSRCRANRSRAIGWKPISNKAEFLASIKPEAAALIKKGKA